MKFRKIYLEITNACNLNCPFCIEDKRKKEFITIENFKYVINECEKFTKYLYLHLKGEPFLHPKIDEILNILDKKDFKVNITTNGFILLDNELYLNHKCINRVNISLQSLINFDDEKREIYFNKLENLIIKNNEIYHKYLFLRLWNSKNRDEEMKLNNQVFEFLEKRLKVKKGTDDKLSEYLFISLDEEFEWPSLSSPKTSDFGHCYGGVDHIGILVDGRVVICCLDSNGDTTLGNVYSASLSDILRSEKYQLHLKNIKQGKLFLELCRKCSFNKKFE